MNHSMDYFIAGLVGFFAGIFAIPILINIGLGAWFLLFAAPWAGACLIIAVVLAGRVAGRWISVLAQFSRFASIGFLNTAIDFGILNLLSMISGVTAGVIVGGVNLPGFSIAVLNSYTWNKLWVFKDTPPGERFFHDFPKFLAVTGIGVLINSGVVIILTTYAAPLAAIAPELRLNIAKIIATMVTLLWNFTGYKLVVFRARPE